jgi:hypothetical protein
MSHWQMHDVSEVLLTSITEEQFATWKKQERTHVIFYRDRYWEELRKGFYQPIHLLARLSADRAKRPTPWCWGYRAALCEDDAAAANGSVAVHLLSNVQDYDIQTLFRKRRTHLRKCLKLVKIVRLTGPYILQKQGYEVLRSALKRTKHVSPPPKKDYLDGLTTYTTNEHRLVLVGIIDDRLGGYVDGHAIDGTAYINNVYIATEALPTSIGTGLIFEFVQACRRSGAIHEVVYGQHSREDPALCQFKEAMGFPVKHIPAKVMITPIIKEYLRRYRPHPYYRLTGRG